MRESAEAKSRRYLCEGRLVVEQVQPGMVRATCRGDGHRWHQAFDAGQWSCTCPCRTDQCSHLKALRAVIAVDLEP